MKKSYNTPLLTSHGTVETLTEKIGLGGTDFYVGPNDPGISPTGTGSINLCATTDLSQCNVKK